MVWDLADFIRDFPYSSFILRISYIAGSNDFRLFRSSSRRIGARAPHDLCSQHGGGGGWVVRGCGSHEQRNFEMSFVLYQFSIQSQYLWYRYRYRCSQNIGKLVYNQNIGKFQYNQNIGKLLYNQSIGKLLYNQNIRKLLYKQNFEKLLCNLKYLKIAV